MKWSWRAGAVSGIAIHVHWTFLALLAWILFAHIAEGETLGVALKGVGFIVAIFVCVVLHELGHAFAARRYGIATRDITLLPIGGVARLERMPEKPAQELVVALAGPSVNVVIAAILFAGIVVYQGIGSVRDVHIVSGRFFTQLLYVNVALFAFNLLPAFPMDGGRVLRALLAMRMDYVRATQTAASVGQAMAIVFAVAGVFFNWFLLFIALFVYLGAQAEAHHTALRSLTRGVPVRAAMITRFRSLTETDRLSKVVEELLSGDQQDFPVTKDGRIVGVLTRPDLIRGLADRGPESPVEDAMRRDFDLVSDADMLDRIFEPMRARGTRAVPVERGGELVGMLTLEHIGEWMMINCALRHGTPRGSIGRLFASE
ncbi:MAG: site-2 protease family protein [Phycisphaerae bacterium]|nr:site-2 protease family protein [Phycisphaerae bacterium]